MKTAGKRTLMIAVILIAAGIVAAVAGFVMIGGDMTRLSTAVMTEETYIVEEPFNGIFINTELGNVNLALSQTDQNYVVSRAYESLKTAVEVEGDTLSIVQSGSWEWQENVGVFFGEPGITVYLTETEFEKLSVGMGDGDVYVPDDFRFTDVMINTLWGDIEFRGAVQKEYSSESVFGDITLSDVNAETIFCKSEQGNIRLKNCDAGSLELETLNGDIEGSLLSGKDFTVDAGYGGAKVPADASGGECQITTLYGDVKMTVR